MRRCIMDEVLIVGTIDAIYFENPSNLYKVVRINVDDELSNALTAEELVITGQFATLHYDTNYEFYGHFTNHPKYGEQFAVTRYQQLAPTSEQGLIDYLSSERFPGIGIKLAKNIVDALGMDAIDIIVADPNALKKVKGLNQKVQVSLRENLLKHQGTERVFMQLFEWGFSPKLADKIYQKYKSSAIEKIKENPYELVESIEGIGFNKADNLAEKLGFEADSVDRIIAGIYTVVNEHCNNNGDTYIEREACLIKSREMLENARPFLLDDSLMNLALDKAILEERLMNLAEGIMIPSLYYAEVGIVSKLSNHLQYATTDYFDEADIDSALAEVMELNAIQYDEQQQAALKLAINSPMSIITGGPGTGKTTLVKGLIHLHATLHEYSLEDLKHKPDFAPILLAAPTGRASKRMNEMTDLPAMTIHRMLGFNRDSDYEDFSAQEELEGNLLIVDEMSMVDTWLMNWLLQAVPYNMQVVFVGDKDQLPSVGPGKVFNDLIASKCLPTIQLNTIYRQNEGSTIVELAHSIKNGALPDNFLEKQNDRSFIRCQTDQVAHVVQTIVAKAQNKHFDGNNMQVLAPMYKGAAGINELNTQLQAIMNPAKKGKREIQYFDTVFRVGDKVLQLVNNAEADVYNGDIGKITAIMTGAETDSNVEEIIVSFDERELTYKRSDLDQLTLAYCCSIHKSQGSEYPLVILPLVDMYSRMLRRDLLYTAITRAKTSLVMVGNPNSFYKATTANIIPRQTFLKDLLKIKFANETVAYEDEEGNLLTIPSETATTNGQHNENTEDTLEQLTLTPTIIDDTKLKSEDHAKSDSLEAKHHQGLTTDEDNSKKALVSDEEPRLNLNELSEETIWLIDPMIGMENLSPYDFMKTK